MPHKRRGDDEADDGDEQEPPAPEPGGEIAGERHHHGGGDDIRGEHPGDLVGRRAERAQHMRDRHVDDGHVEHFEHRGQHHGDDERDRRPFGMQARRGGRRTRRLGGRLSALAALCRRRASRGSFCRPSAGGSVVSMVTSALAPTRSGLSASGVLVILIRTGKRWVTLTQLPVAFSGGSTEKVAPEPALIASTTPSSLVPGYMSRRMVAGWPGLMRARSVSLKLASTHQWPSSIRAKAGRAGLHDGAGAQIAVGDPAAAGRGDVGAHPLMRRLVELGGGGAELHGRRGHGQLGVLRLGEFGLGVFVGLHGVVPGLQRVGDRLRGRLALLLRILGVAIFAERVLERHALLLELVGGGLEIVGRGAGGGRRRVELGARIAQRRVVERGIDVEQGIAGGDLVVVTT